VRTRLAAAALSLAAALPNVVPAALRAQPARADTGTSAAPVPPWERRSGVGLTLGGAGLYQSARGATGARVQDGGGFDAFAGVSVAALLVSVGYQRTEHRLDAAGAGRATEQGLFLEPRLSVAPFRNFTPYVAGRVAFLRRAVPASARYAAETRSLTGFGAGLGTLVAVAPGVQLDFGAMYSRLGGGASTAAAPGAFAGGTGNAAVLRAGLVIGSGRWGR
jgi:opacity protein-like surface antigen